MAKHHLRNAELDVHRILDGPVRLNSAYGAITVPQGHFVINFPGEFELSTALPPDAFMAMFDLSDDERAEWGLPGEDDETPADGDVNPPTKLTPSSTGPDAVIGVGGDYPPDRPDTLPQSPVAGSSIGPASTTPVGVNPPTDQQIRDWTAAHYSEQYRDRVNERLIGNRTRAADLLDRYPLAAATTAEPPAPEAVIAPGQLVDPNADVAAPTQTATTEPEPPVLMAGTTPVDQIPGATGTMESGGVAGPIGSPTPDQIPGATETTQGQAPSGAPGTETGEGSFPMPTAEPGLELAAQQEPPVAPNQASDMQPSPGEDVVVTPDEPTDKQTNVVPPGEPTS